MEENATPPIKVDPEIIRIIEALLFTAENPMRAEQLLEIFNHEEFFGLEVDAAIVDAALDELAAKLRDEEHVYELRRIDKGFQLYTKRAYYPYVRHAAMVKSKRKLSRASLETLSIIAYRQPITKTEIEFIRGVNCDYTVRQLLEKQLIEITGRSDAPGRPLLYSTSSFFMEYFGLNELKDLPQLKDIQVDEEEFRAQFKVYVKGEDEEDSEAESAEEMPADASATVEPIQDEEE